MDFDWSNAAKVVVSTTLSQYPAVGPGLAALVNIFWPKEKTDVWADIRKQVEQMINQKLSDFAYGQVQNSLQGLRNAISAFLKTIETKDTAATASHWIALSVVFEARLPSFQAPGYQLVLLPLFAQFANLHLMMLREGARAKGAWGWNDEFQKKVRQDLKEKIADYSKYTEEIFRTNLDQRTLAAGHDNHLCQPFLTANKFTREITLTVLDFRTLWQYFDIDAYPDPVKVYLDREIYSDPCGSGDAGPIKLPSPPKQFPWWMTVWSTDRLIKAIGVAYHSGMGPNGVTETPRMGWPDGGSPWRNSSNMAIEPVVKVAGWSGNVIDSLEFSFKRYGRKSGTLGNRSEARSFEFSYEGHLMSSIWINGISTHYKSADCVVFGFKMDPLWQPNKAAVRALFMGGFPLSEQDAALTGDGPSIASLAAEEGWEAERQAFWTSVQSYAAAD